MSETTVTTPGRVRPRRLRRNKVIRDLAAETQLSASQFIVPHFVLAARRAERPIPSMPGIAELGVDNLVSQVASDLDLGIRSVLLFGHPDHAGHKTPDGKAAWAPDGAVQRTTRRLKAEFSDDLVVLTDVCL